MTRWINERLGTSAWGGHEESADTAVVDVRALRDAAGNPSSVIREYIDAVANHWKNNRKVVICCDYGVSRSNAIAAGVLSTLTGRSYDEAVKDVIAATGEQQIKLDVVRDIRAALGEPFRESKKCGTFVIGSEGFPGRALVQALRADNIECSAGEGASLSANPVLLDALIGEQAPERMLFCWHPPQLDTNGAAGTLITGLRNVLEVCRQRNTGIVFVSGFQVFAGRNDEMAYRCTEDEEPVPAGAAGDGLFLAEQLVRIYASRHGLDALIIRPSHLYGPDDERPTFLNTFMRKAILGSDIDIHSFTNGAPCIDVLHVNDFARGAALAVKSGLSGVLHLASGDCLDNDKLVREVLRIAGGAGKIQVIDLPKNCSRTMLDASRARLTLDWKPNIPLAEGLRETLEQIKMNMAKKKGRSSI